MQVQVGRGVCGPPALSSVAVVSGGKGFEVLLSLLAAAVATGKFTLLWQNYDRPTRIVKVVKKQSVNRPPNETPNRECGNGGGKRDSS